MASFRDYLTAEGERMLAKAVAGTKITFTKCVLGSGYMNPGMYEKNVTDVIAKEQEVPIQSVTVNSNDSVLVTAYFNNKKVTKGFYCREKGIYMSDGKEEVLAIYGNNGSEAEFIDTGDVCVVEKMIKSVLEITDEERANIEIVDALYEFAPVIEPDTATIADFVTTLTARTMKIGQRVILNKSIAYTYVGDDPTDVACYIAGSGAQLSDIYDKEIPNGDADGGIGASQNALAKVYTELTGHEEKIVYGESGVHGIRYWEGVLQVLDADGNWIDIDSSGGTGSSGSTPGEVAPGNVSGLSIAADYGKLTIKWSDPQDTIVDGQTLCIWKGTKLVQKAGSYPEDVSDGTLLLDNQTRDAYKDNGFEINGLKNGTTYYFSLFPYSNQNIVNKNEANRISGVTKQLKIVTWADGTDEEISEMIAAHYSGQIDIADYWAVGDMRTIHLSAMAATGVGESHVAQDQQFVIIGIEHDNLKTPINGKTKAAITIQPLRVLSNGTTSEDGYMNSSGTNSGGWEGCARRTWCNNVFVNALPLIIKQTIKTVSKLNYKVYDSNTLTTTSDSAFLLSEVEVFGKQFFAEGATEGTQYEYFVTLSNTRKYRGNATSSGSSEDWWERSPSATSNSRFCFVDSSDCGGMHYSATTTFGLCPAICL